MNFILLHQKCVVPLPVVRLRLKVSLCSRPTFVSIQRRGFPCRSSYLTFLFASVSHLSGKKCFAFQMRLEVCRKFRVTPVSRGRRSVNVKSPAETQRSSPLAFTFSPTIIQNRKVFFFFLNQTATCCSYHAEKSYV